MGLGSRREVPSDYRDRVRWRQPIPSLPLRPRSGGRSRGLLEGAAATALACLAACGGEAEVQGPPNVLLFAVDTLRADRVGALSGVDLTPRIDAFAAGARVYESAYSQATQTHPAMASVMTGLAPPHHGVVSQAQRHSESVVTLAELLADRGHRTGSFVANLCQLQDYGRTVWSDGWEEQFCGEDLGAEQHEWDASVVDAALEWIDSGEEPFFAWLHLMDPHSEYRPTPEDWDYAARPVRSGHDQSVFYGQFLDRYERPPEPVLDELEALYDAQIHGIDRHFGRVIDHLERTGRLDNTLVVFVADHGEELFETWPKVGHGFSLTEAVLHVPLMIAGPGVDPGRVRETVETLQVTPTVLEYLDVDAPYALDGPSLLGETISRGWAASYVGDRATVRRDRRRWWGRSSKLTVVPAVTDYLERYPSHTRTPWYQAEEVFAEYAPGSHEPQWLDLSDAGFERAVRVAFKQPLLSFIREGAETDLIDDGKLERALDRLGYR